MKCLEARAVRWPEVRKFYGLEAANGAQNVRVDTAHEKDNNQHTLSKMIM